LPLTSVTLIAAIIAGIAFGLTARIFARLTRKVNQDFKNKIAYPPLRPVVGGLLLALVFGNIGLIQDPTKYMGLGIPTIVNAFKFPLPIWDFAVKLGVTALTLGTGFKGGEVTPLFFIGATLGNVLSNVLPLSMPLLAGMGFVAVFGGAANTPIAALLMGIELFGIESGIYIAIACVMSYLFSGQSGIYHTQKKIRKNYPENN
jgi:H+/Cl- antiporter ClcA